MHGKLTWVRMIFSNSACVQKASAYINCVSHTGGGHSFIFIIIEKLDKKSTAKNDHIGCTMGKNRAKLNSALINMSFDTDEDKCTESLNIMAKSTLYKVQIKFWFYFLQTYR